MRIHFLKNAATSQVGEVARIAGELIGNPSGITLGTENGCVFIVVPTNGRDIDPNTFLEFQGVSEITGIDAGYKIAALMDPSSGEIGERTVIEFPHLDCSFGKDQFVVMAGPCAVEDEDGLLKIAHKVKSAGGRFLRGGAFKPRTSPYSFQGLGDEGLGMLGRVREQTGIGIITEAMEPSAVERVSEVADIIQIGSRNMQNYPLLKEAGRGSKPVLLKRGMSATLEEWLGAAEYILSEGNPNVILCERGIRTFSRHSRHTLDIGVIPVIHERSKLPVVVDPSHATGAASKVPSMAKAALAAGADGLLIEVHPDPKSALSDGYQALDFEEFERLMVSLVEIGKAVEKRL